MLYVPGLRELETMKLVVSSVGKPLKVVMGMADPALTADQLAWVGVKRIRVGAALSRLVLAAFMKGAREMEGKGRLQLDSRDHADQGPEECLQKDLR